MKGKDIVKALLKKDWYVERVRGSHTVLKSADKKLMVVVPCHNYDLQIGIIKSILKDAKISIEEVK